MLGYNQQVLETLNEVSRSQEITEAFLINFEGLTPPTPEDELAPEEELEAEQEQEQPTAETIAPEDTAGQVLFTFLFPPTSLSFDGSVTYDQKSAIYDTKGRLKFQSTSPLTLQLDNVILLTPCREKSVRSLLQELDNLRYPVQDGAISPPSLSLVIGQRVIQPLVLTSIRWDEKLCEGEPIEAPCSMTLQGFDRVTF